MTPDTDPLPLTPDEERRHRQYIMAARREGPPIKGGMFDMAARLLATLDDARAALSSPPTDLTLCFEPYCGLPGHVSRVHEATLTHATGGNDSRASS